VLLQFDAPRSLALASAQGVARARACSEDIIVSRGALQLVGDFLDLLVGVRMGISAAAGVRLTVGTMDYAVAGAL